MTDVPLPSLAAQIDATGISAPTYADILDTLRYGLRSIFGPDLYLEPDSQDGQMIGIFAKAIRDSNDLAIATYNSFSPSTAQGNGLSTNVKINGLSRLLPSNSSADLTIIGTPGTVLTGARAIDTNGEQWKIPDETVIPPGGLIVVTALADTIGDVRAEAHTINRIGTPTRGWQSVDNDEVATVGAPVETDAALRRRQAVSTSLPAQSVMDGIMGAIANLAGVELWRGYENWTDGTDVNGIPSHSIAVVVLGGDDDEIADTIAIRKTPGTGTFGSTTVVVLDSKGVPQTVRFFRPDIVRIKATINIKALPRYVSTTGDAMAQAVADYVSALGIGEPIYLNKLYTPANMEDQAVSSTYKVNSILISRYPSDPAAQDLILAFNELAELSAEDTIIQIS